jgi:hypothetical protein
MESHLALFEPDPEDGGLLMLMIDDYIRKAKPRPPHRNTTR